MSMNMQTVVSTSNGEHVTPARSAERIVESLNRAGVKYVFGVPGAKVDQLYDALKDGGPQIVLCRHEQDAAFMAACIGRLTGTPGVAVVTSGPGTTNLATGLLTATTEGDPIVALCGAVPRADRLKHTHQSMDAAGMLATVSKYAAEVDSPDNVPEAVADAFRRATTMPRGAAALVLPSDVLGGETAVTADSMRPVPKLGPAPVADLDQAAKLIRDAKFPVILAGVRAACTEGADALSALLQNTQLPVVETFQGAGLVSRDLEDHYLGRVGIFRNQPGDVVLDQADVVLAIGYDPVEYDAKMWNHKTTHTIISLDEVLADADAAYRPALELRGDIPATVRALADRLSGQTMSPAAVSVLDEQRTRLSDDPDEVFSELHDDAKGLDPVAVVLKLREAVNDETTVISDIGSHYIYMARHFRTYRPRHLLFSNGQQTLGVALPWAIATSLVRPNTPVLSVSGDGGFLFSAQELETAHRLGVSFTHVIFNDSTYDMVAFQQQMKYGRTSGIQLGGYDVVKYAESFGAHGYRVTSLEELGSTLKQALAEPGASIIDVPVDYSDNLKRLAGQLQEGVLS